MTNVKVSVVIPVYNSEKYLEQCLDSVVHQTLQEIEVICIDDGSSDGSLEVLERYQKQDCRISVFTQPNSGVGSARNNGLSRASGEYVVFLDSDDLYFPEALEKAYTKAIRDKADVCVFGMTYYCEDSREKILYDVLPNKKNIPDILPFNISNNEKYILNFAYNVTWNKIYRRDFLINHNIQFPLIRRGEDFLFCHLALCLAERITVLREPLLTYRLFRQGSLMTELSDNPDDFVESWFVTAEKLKEKEVYPEQSFLNNTLGSLVRILRPIRMTWPAFESFYNQLKEGTLERLGLVPKAPGYYYNAWNEEVLNKLFQTEDARSFLLSYVSLLDMRNREQNARKRTQEKKYRSNIEQQKKYISELKIKNRKQKEQIQKLKDEKKGIINSISYRIGLVITWIPREIKGMLSRKKIDSNRKR